MSDEQRRDVWAWGTDPDELIHQCGRAIAHLPHDTVAGRCPGRAQHADPRYRSNRRNLA